MIKIERNLSLTFNLGILNWRRQHCFECHNLFFNAFCVSTLWGKCRKLSWHGWCGLEIWNDAQLVQMRLIFNANELQWVLDFLPMWQPSLHGSTTNFSQMDLEQINLKTSRQKCETFKTKLDWFVANLLKITWVFAIIFLPNFLVVAGQKQTSSMC